MSPLHGKPAGQPARSEPSVAALLTLFVPGLGHLHMGRVAYGLVAFVIIEGLYLAGYLLSDGLAFAYLDPELRSRFAVALTPELGNLGALLWHFSTVGFGGPDPLAWPEHMRLGSTLTALSGVLNACLMVQAHLHARGLRAAGGGAPSPAFLVAAAWAVPGLGHLLQGRALRALIVAVLLVGLFFCGCELSAWSNLSRERHFYYWAGQFFVGLPAIGTELVGLDRPVTEQISLVDAGLLFGCVAGLLNVLAMLDVYGFAEDRLLGRDGDAPPDRGEMEPKSPGTVSA